MTLHYIAMQYLLFHYIVEGHIYIYIYLDTCYILYYIDTCYVHICMYNHLLYPHYAVSIVGKYHFNTICAGVAKVDCCVQETCWNRPDVRKKITPCYHVKHRTWHLDPSLILKQASKTSWELHFHFIHFANRSGINVFVQLLGVSTAISGRSKLATVKFSENSQSWFIVDRLVEDCTFGSHHD